MSDRPEGLNFITTARRTWWLLVDREHRYTAEWFMTRSEARTAASALNREHGFARYQVHGYTRKGSHD